MMMRAKFRVEQVAQSGGQTRLTMQAVTGGSSEDNSFSQATPNASLSMTITNPDLLDSFAQGDAFYVDFTKADRLEPFGEGEGDAEKAK